MHLTRDLSACERSVKKEKSNPQHRRPVNYKAPTKHQCASWSCVEESFSDSKAHTHKTEWWVEDEADLRAVWIYDCTQRKRQGMTHGAVRWRHRRTLTTVAANGVTASKSLCEMCVCAGCLVVEKVSQTSRWGKRREASGSPRTISAFTCGLQVPVLWPRPSERPCVQEQDALRTVVQVCEITILIVRPYF